MGAEHLRFAGPAPSYDRTDGADRGAQIVLWRGHRGGEQAGRAVPGMEAGHLPDRRLARHAVGARAAVHVQIDETRQDETVLGSPIEVLDPPDPAAEGQAARAPTGGGKNPAVQMSRAHRQNQGPHMSLALATRSDQAIVTASEAPIR